MRSTERSGSDASQRDEDLTTRARIRDAAILLFGRDGFDRATVRTVAAEAGVSAGLVIHHFGSKDGLRAACDEHMVDIFVTRSDELLEGQASARIQEWLADLEGYRPAIDYLMRMLLEPGAAADAAFDALLTGTRHMLDTQEAAGMVRPSSDPDVVAAIVAAQGLVPLLLGRQLARVLGEGDELLSESLLRRLTLPILELYTHGLYTDDRLLEASRVALDAQP